MEESHHASSSSSSSRDQRHPSSSTSYAWRHHHHPNSDRNDQPGYAQEVKHITQYASHQSHRVADSTTTPLMGTLLPPRGLPGMRVFVYLPISFLQHGRHFKLAFNRTLVDTQLTYAGEVVTLTAYVPYRESTQAQNNIVHVTLCLVEGQEVRNQWDLGEFTYEQHPPLFSEPWSTHPISALAVSQRGSSVSHSCSNNNSASTSAAVHDTRATSGGGGDSTTLDPGASPLHATTTYDGKGPSSNSILSFRSQFRVEPHRVVAPTEVLHQHPQQQQPSRQSSKRSKRRPESNINTASQGERETSIIPPAVPYEFYLSLPLTVGFEMLDDFEDILKNWSETEIKESRRVVWFSRVNSVADIRQQQERRMRDANNHVVVYCKCAPADIQFPLITNEVGDMQGKGALVSCIAWEGEHYVTSVDVIKILEEMLNKSFTVQSKNRVRRNLEGFKPITASKHKPETVSLFKLIMGFNHPRPRNIEKDIKVFYWRTLPVALNKVIDKYFLESLSTRIAPKNASNHDRPLLRTTLSFPTTSRAKTTPSSTRHPRASSSLDGNKDTKSKDTPPQ